MLYFITDEELRILQRAAVKAAKKLDLPDCCLGMIQKDRYFARQVVSTYKNAYTLFGGDDDVICKAVSAACNGKEFDGDEFDRLSNWLDYLANR